MIDDTHPGVASQPQDVTFLTPRDVQRELRIGERLCYRLLKSGAIPHVRVNGMYRINRKALDEALESGAVLEGSK